MTLTSICAETASELTVREARDQFLAAYGLGQATYTDPRFVLHLGPWKLGAPNPGLLPLHDLHHVATGFGSGILGEAEISAFELRTGWGNPPHSGSALHDGSRGVSNGNLLGGSLSLLPAIRLRGYDQLSC